MYLRFDSNCKFTQTTNVFQLENNNNEILFKKYAELEKKYESLEQTNLNLNEILSNYELINKSKC